MINIYINHIDIYPMQWEALPSDAQEYSPRTGHTVIAYQGGIYVFGGIDEQDRQNDMHLFSGEKWQALTTYGDAPAPRSGSLACLFEDQFYFFGGYTWKHGEYYNDLYRFDPRTITWEKLNSKNPPSARVDHTFTSVQNFCYVFGGSNGLKRFSDLHELNLITLEWKQLGSQGISNRFGHSMVSYQHQLYLFGGWDGNNTLNDLWIFKDSKFSPLMLTNPPAGRYRHTATVHKNYMVIFGGVDQNQERFNDLQTFDFNTSIWQRVVVQNPPSPRSFHKCVMLNSYMYLVGGFDGQRRNDVHRIRLDQEHDQPQKQQMKQQISKWNKLDVPSKFSPRTGHTVCTYQSNIYLFGGIDQDGEMNNDLFVFNQIQWIQLRPTGTMPSPRSGAKMVAIDESLLIFGGYIKIGEKHCNDLYRYQIKLNHFIVENSPALPSRRTDFSIAEYRGILYIFGGKGENKQILSDVWRFRKEWRQIHLEQPIVGRFGHSAVAHQNSMFIFGGWDGQTCLEDLVEFSFVTNMIYEIRRSNGTKPKARYRHEALVYNDDMFIFGGVDQNQVRYNDLHQYNFRKREWSLVATQANSPSPRTFHKFVNLENLLFVIGGFDGVRQNDVYTILVPQSQKLKFSYPTEDSQVMEGQETQTLKEQVKELSHKIQKEEEKHLCKICFQGQIDSVLMECGHFFLCFKCASKLKNEGNRECPICRQQITKVIKTSMY